MKLLYFAFILTCSLIPLSAAYGSEPEIIDLPHVWVFVVDSACAFDAAELRADIQGVPAYAPHLQSLDVVCFPHAPMLELAPIVGVLKQAFPHDVFVFAYNPAQVSTKIDWQLLISQHYSKSSAGHYGKAFIPQGYAITVGAPHEIAHEATHLTLYAHHPAGTDMDDPTTWRRWGSSP